MTKITQDAKDRCAAHTLQEQLEQLKAMHDLERLLLQHRQSQDQADIEAAFCADKSWSGQHARLSNTRGFEQHEE